jgi:HSP20 family protein
VAKDRFEERWENFRDLVEHLFLEPGRGSIEADMVWYPATDAYETEDAFVIRLDLSGVKREAIQIHMKDRAVEVRGIREEPPAEGRRTFHKMEIAMGPFARCVQVPERFAGGEAKASYEGGVLEIRIQPRRREGPRDIQVEVE